MDAMLELSRTGLGTVAVCDEANRVQGVFTDGDLRRWLVAGGTLNDGVTRAMTRNGVTLQADSRAVEAKERLMKHKISAAPVVDENGQLVGAINLQNFYRRGSFKPDVSPADAGWRRPVPASGGRRPVAWFASSARLMASLKRVGRLAQIDVSRRGRRCRRLSRQHRRRHRKLEMLRLGTTSSPARVAAPAPPPDG